SSHRSHLGECAAGEVDSAWAYFDVAYLVGAAALNGASAGYPEVPSMTTTASEVTFMPWANVKKDLSIGPFRLWQWDRSRVKDPAVAAHLEKYFQSHVDHHSKCVSSITIVSTNDTFAPVSSRYMENARIAADIL